MKSSYIDYAMSVIVGRALPDVRDGLKPVHRRVLYAMFDQGFTSKKAFVKSARTVGEVLGKYHPHGDSAVYDTLVRMAQDFSLRYPLIDGHGNFGSVDGDEAAAMRYTEARLKALAEEMLRDLEMETVDWMPNFDGSLNEPIVLPSKFPNLLVNGSSGIAVGMATNMPSHNLTEVINGVVALIENPDLSIEELMEHVPGPDFPTGGIIMGLCLMLILKIDNPVARGSITFITGFVGCAVMGSLWTFTGLTFARTRGLALGVLTTWSYAIASLSPITIGWIGDHYRVSTGLFVICVPVVFLACATFAATNLVKKQ